MPITFRGRDLIVVHLALHFMSSYPAAFSDSEMMWEIRNLSTTIYDAIQKEHQKEARAYEKKNKLPKGSMIRAPRKMRNGLPEKFES